MRGIILGFLFSSMLTSGSDGLHVQESPVTCSREGVECYFNEDNLIDTLIQIPNVAECRQLCQDEDQCEYITYFYKPAIPVSEMCRMFTTCDSVISCENCISQNMGCFETCGSNIFGQLNENLLDAVSNVASELECKSLCSANEYCSWYTYFYPNDTVNHEHCFLQTEFLPPSQPCKSCISGPVDCTSSTCFFEINGEFSQSVMLSNTGETFNITVNGFGSCELRFLAIGGGGNGYDNIHGYAGAGSGYVQYKSIHFDLESLGGGIVISAQVGDQSETSSVNILNGDNSIGFDADRGQNGGGYNGGSGYSGGGGYNLDGNDRRPHNGGTDGGDGGSNAGGAGSGQDISAYIFRSWTLTPGAGGKPCYSNFCSYGGGGGGILVNGAGPDWGNNHQGQGYGGGGSGESGGLQGVVLFEIFGGNSE